MNKTKTELLQIRVSPDIKKTAQSYADRYHQGSLSHAVRALILATDRTPDPDSSGS